MTIYDANQRNHQQETFHFLLKLLVIQIYFKVVLDLLF